MRLALPSRLGALEFSSIASLEIELAEDLPIPFPLPRPPSRLVNQDDFPAILADVRELATREFGAAAASPAP